MSCPTCDHTMHVIVTDHQGMRHSLCPRCGTHTVDNVLPLGVIGWTHVSTWVPKLVERCRQMEKNARDTGLMSPTDWVRLGIAESINVPADRPPV